MQKCDVVQRSEQREGLEGGGVSLVAVGQSPEPAGSAIAAVVAQALPRAGPVEARAQRSAARRSAARTPRLAGGVDMGGARAPVVALAQLGGARVPVVALAQVGGA